MKMALISFLFSHSKNSIYSGDNVKAYLLKVTKLGSYCAFSGSA